MVLPLGSKRVDRGGSGGAESRQPARC